MVTEKLCQIVMDLTIFSCISVSLCIIGQFAVSCCYSALLFESVCNTNINFKCFPNKKCFSCAVTV